MKKINILLLSFIIISFTISCGDRQVLPSQITDEIAGEYVFKYPSGQIEVVFIKSDSFYKQVIYSDEVSYKNNDSSLYENLGSWSVSEKKVTFNNWLMYNYLRNPDSVLVTPRSTTLMDVYWYNYNNKKPSLLSVFSDNGYVFKKVGK